MKKLTIVLLSVLFLSGCINITEEIFLEKDGSGKYAMTVDMKQMQDMLDMLKAFSPDSTQGKDMNLSSLDSIQNMMGDLSGVPGITEVKKEKKADNVYVVSFRFRDIQALNEAMKKRNEKQPVTSDMYSFSKGSFSCNDTTLFGLNDAMKDIDNEMGSSDSVQAAMDLIKGMMGDMTYTSIYHLPGKVKSFSNKDAKLSEDGQTLTLQINLLDKEKSGTLRNNIVYKK